MVTRVSIITVLILSLSFSQVNKDITSKSLYQYLKNLPKSEAVIEGIEYAIEFGSPEVKSLALEALVEMESAESFRVLNRYVAYGIEEELDDDSKENDLSWMIRAKCASGLAKINNEKSALRLRRVLYKEDHYMVKKAIITALGDLKDKESVTYLTDMLVAERDESLVYTICVALGKIGDKKCFLPLLQVRSGNYKRTTKIAAQVALDSINW